MAGKKSNYLACDFETSFTDETRSARKVVLAGFSSLNYATDRVDTYSNIEDFFHALARFDNEHQGKMTLFFHNLDYDASYMEDFFLRNEIPFKELREFDTKTLYKMEVNYHGHELLFYDSLKLYPGSSIEKLGEMVGVRKLVGDYDYEKVRHGKNDFTFLERQYFRHDIIILRKVLEKHFKDHHKLRLTRSSYAYAALKREVRSNDAKLLKEDRVFHRIFKPSIERAHYDYLHNAYFGGFTYANPEFTNQELGQGFVFDVNSLYPSVMVTDFPLLDSEVKLTHDKFKELDWLDQHTFFVATIRLNKLKMKKNTFPCLPKKMNFRSNEVVYSLDDVDYPYVTLTNLDFYWLFENYDLEYEFVKGYYYPEFAVRPFESFILKNNKGKEEAGRAGNKFQRLMFKLSNNSSYGKFGQKPDFQSSQPVLNDNGIVTFIPIDEDQKDDSFNNVLIADFVTAKARNVLYHAIRAVNESNDFDFVYCDTDSIHILNYTDFGVDDYKEIAKILPINIDPQKLGYWKLENDFNRAKFLRSKAYYEESTTDGQVVKLAGVSPDGKQEIRDKINKYGLKAFKIPMTVPSTRKRRMKGGYNIESYQKEIKPKWQTLKREEIH